ncbi:hypothetical protein, conserved [Angomonas deanei]|uniref:DUF7623 domain-containing protein n=1 Tax=Angomonas deanei TaxID=59799 RepID=A0A7G2CUI9_9TRYP|nr:hypothetical protein, conserved [Angomonas deanei]
MNDRVRELADKAADDEQKAAEPQRELMREYPMCGVDPSPAIPRDAEFAELSGKRDALLTDPEKNADEIRDVEEAMHDRANELAARDKRCRRPSTHLKPKSAEVSMVEDDEVAELPDEDGGLPDQPLKREAQETPCLAGTDMKDPYYEQLEALRDALIEEDPDKNAPAIRCVEEQMKDRAEQLKDDDEKAAAEQARQKDALLEQMPFLPSEINGIPIEELPLKDDEPFAALAEEHARLAQDPEANEEALKDVEEQMKDRAKELADQAAEEEKALRDALPFVDVGKTPLRELDLDSDPEFAKLHAAYDELAKDPETANGPEAKRLEKAMNDLAQLIAFDEAAAKHRDAIKEADLHEEFPFLPDEPIDGITLRDAGVMEDPEFRALANQLEDLKKEDPVKNADGIKALEDQLKDRAEELAKDVKDATDEAKEKYPFLPKRVDDVLLGNLPLDTDEKFQELANQLEELKKEDPVKNADEIKALEDQLKDRAEELADRANDVEALYDADNEDVRAHNPFLEKNDVRGVPLRELGLEDDEPYKKLWNDRLQLMEDPVKNADEIKAVEEQLKDRADELADEKIHAEDEVLAKYPFVEKPRGAPMLPTLGVPEDEQFSELAKQHDDLAQDPEKNAEALKAVEDAMNDRVRELADKAADDEQKAAEPQRELMREYPMCGVDPSPAIPRDAEFAELSGKRDALLTDPEKNADEIRDVEEAMHDRANELAARDKRRRRPSTHLKPKSAEMSMIEDNEVSELPEEDGGLPDQPLKREAQETPCLAATDMKDPYYEQLEALRDALIAEDPDKNAPAIRCVEEQMKDRAEQLKDDDEKAAAEQARQKDALLEQMPFLPSEINGIPIEELPLKDDEPFAALAEEHARLAQDPEANEEALKDVEEQMKDRAKELADQAAEEEKALRDALPFVDVGKTPLRELDLDSDPEFAKLHAAYDELAKDPETANGPEAKRLEKAMNDLAQLIAFDEAAAKHRDAIKEADLHEEFPFLPDEPIDGITLRDAGVMEDPEFRALANQLEDLKKEDPVKNAPKIKGLEDQLKDRAEELAKDVKDATDEAKEKYPFLPKRVDDVLLGNLPLDTDEKFQELANQLEELKKEDPVKNADEIKALEDQLKDRAEELADRANDVEALYDADNEDVRAHNPFLEKNDVRGVPLRELGLEDDEPYKKLWNDRLQLMEDPVKNADEIKAVEETAEGPR